MRDLLGPLTAAVAVALSFGCAQMRSSALDVDMALSKVAAPSSAAKEPPKAVANAPAKVDPIPSVVTTAKPSDIQQVGAAAYPQRPPTRRPAYRTVDGQMGGDGVYELAVGLRVHSRPSVANTALSAQSPPSLEPIDSTPDDNPPVPPPLSETMEEPAPLPPSDLIAETQNGSGPTPGVPIPRTDVEPADIPDTASNESDPPGESLVARVVPRAVINPNSQAPLQTQSEGLALTGMSEVRSDELLALLAARGGLHEAADPEATEPIQTLETETAEGSPLATAAATTPTASSDPVDEPKEDSAPAVLDFVPEPPTLAQGQARIAPPPAMPEPTQPASPTAGLALAHFHLCREILGFGSTTPMSGPAAPGQQLLAYVEVLDSEAREVGGLFETKLACRIAVEDPTGKTVAEQDFGQITDRCYAQRKDFFCHFVFTLPGNLTPGPYKLRLFAMDTSDMARAEGCLDFEVRSPAASKEGGEP